MSAIWFQARAELRARWRAWLAIALLLGIFGGAAAAAAAGARRTSSAYPRFLEQARAYDAFIGDFSPFAPNVFWKPDFDALERSGIVGGSAGVHVFFGSDEGDLLAPDDGAFGSVMNRPKMLAGRMPRTASEVSVPFAWDRARGMRVGDPLTLTFEPGPRIEMTVVGVHAMPGDFPPTDLLGELFVASPAFTERYRAELFHTRAVFVVMPEGRSVGELGRWVREHAGGMLTNVYRNIDQARNVQRSFDLQAAALWFFAGGLGIALVLVMGQTIARQASLDATDRPTLRALGMSRGQTAMITVARAAVTGLLGGLIAATTAIASSPLFPRGLPRVAETHPGVSVDAVVVVVSIIGITALSVVAALLPALRSSGVATLRTKPSLAGRLARLLGAPPSRTAGVRFALEPGRGSSAVPVRSTIAAVALGLAAVTAVLTFGSSLDHLIDSPQLFGRGWNHEFGFGGDSAVPESARRAVLEDPSVEAAAVGANGMVFDIQLPNGEVLPVTGMALEGLLKGSIVRTPTEGRYPEPGEVVLGPRTRALLGVDIGESIELALGGGAAHPVTVVGEVLVPPLAEQSQPGDGVWIHWDTLGTLAPVGLESIPPADQLILRFSEGRPVEEQAQALRPKLENVDQDFRILRTSDLVNFGRVQNMPLILAALLAALSAGALVHVLLSAIRRRRRDIAILKTLGFSSRQTRRTVSWQASIIAIVALSVGVPLGIAGGRSLWSLFTSRVYALTEHAMPWPWIAAIVPAGLLIANIVAARPAYEAARTSPAITLRAET